jgi:oxepin-CoA hydrolase / 3-oxo-5,6-dehydrosuberyl-CoA semialdehyde dehydrogenase
MAAIVPLTRENITHWKNRLSRIEGNTPRQFGKLSPADMMAHLRRTIQAQTGEFAAPASMSNLLTRTRLFQEFFLFIPWPKGKVKAPDWITPPAEGTLEAERTRLFATMDRFVELVAENPRASFPNALLGNVSREFSTRLHGKHLNHHCEQFGV